MGFENRHYYRDSYSGGNMGGAVGSRLSGASIVIWLLGINTVIYFMDFILTTGSRVPGWLSPSLLGNYNIDQAVFKFQIWRFVTYQFLHAGFMHLFFNMIGLFFFGPLLERWWGSRRFLAFYLLCGISGAVLMTILYMIPGFLPINPSIPLVGASGSIFGILAGAAVLYPHHRVMLLFPPIPMSMRTMAIFFMVIAFLSLVVGTQNAAGEAAHLGGAALGFLLIKKPRWLDWADSISMKSSTRSMKRNWADKKADHIRRDRQEVDRILAKVKENGLQSLTAREKRILSRETDRQRGT